MLSDTTDKPKKKSCANTGIYLENPGGGGGGRPQPPPRIYAGMPYDKGHKLERPEENKSGWSYYV